jgi:hypothetical protein
MGHIYAIRIIKWPRMFMKTTLLMFKADHMYTQVELHNQKNRIFVK